ncbi:MAG: PQQ-binding-like beta-propeller repeat protein [bacterium]|nr:PQQ-binding-like beta-propeller repeat protein [bacterium]
MTNRAPFILLLSLLLLLSTSLVMQASSLPGHLVPIFSAPTGSEPLTHPDDWVSFRGGPSNAASRIFETATRQKPTEWSFKPSPWTWAYRPGTGVWSSPSIARVGERVILFVGSYDNNLYAVDAFSGGELWRFTTGGEIFSTPGVANINGKHTVFFGSAERILYALDAETGAKIWAYQLVDWRYTVGESRISSPAVFSLDGKEVVLFCWWVHDASFARPLETTEALLLDCENGQRVWQTRFSKSPPSSPCIAAIDGQPRIFVSARDGNTYCLDGKSGDLLWKHTSQGEVLSSPSCAAGLDPPLIFVGSRYGALHALDSRDGSPVWSFKAGHWIDSSPAIVEMAGEPYALFGSHDQSVYCLNARTGRLRWNFPTKGDVYSSPAVFEDGQRTLVAVASGDDYLYLLDAWSGKEIWRDRPGRFLWGYRIVGDSIWSSPVAARLNGQWMLFAPFYDGQVHAYSLGEAKEMAKHRSSYGEVMLLKIASTIVGTLLVIGILFRLGRQ